MTASGHALYERNLRMRERLRNVNPIIWILLAIMLVESITSSHMSIWEWAYTKLLILPGIIIGLSFHEAAHAFASYKLGDPTPKFQGRLTLNPLKHFDPAGFIALLFIGFGWGVPVQINPDYYKNRRAGELIVSLAGVTANFLIAAVFAFLVKGMAASSFASGGLGSIIYQMLIYIVYINLVLMIFNLIPIPPLDGFGVITQLFNLDRYGWWYTVYNYGYYILLIAIILNIPALFITPGVSFFLKLLLG